MHALILTGLTAVLPALLLLVPHDWWFLPLHAAALGLTLTLAWRSAVVDRYLESRPLARWTTIVVAAALVTLTLFGETPRATWGVIDDHAVHELIGPGHDRLPAADILPMLARHPEFGAPTATQTRYRPAYYGLYLGQAALWGKDARPWFVFRLLLCCFTAALGFDLVRRWLGTVTAATALASLAALWMWFDIFGKLGSGETYAAPACIAFAWCAVAILRSGPRAGPLLWVGLAVAALVAIGSKENFVVLAPLTILIAGVERRAGGRGWAGPIAAMVVCIAAALVIGVVSTGIVNNGGRDVYQRSVGLSGVFNLADPAARRTARKLLTYAVPLLAGFVMAARAWLRSGAADRQRRTTCATAAVLCLVALSQVVFYRGDVFKKCRYDLPLVPLIGVVAIGLVQEASRLRGGSPAQRRIRRRLLVPGVLGVTALAFGGDHSRAAVRAYVATTSEFQRTVQDIAAACRSDPNLPVTFIMPSDPTASYEPILSVASYLRSFAIGNRFFLVTAPAAPDALPQPTSWQARALAEITCKRSENFTPTNALDGDADRIEVWFAQDSPAGRRTFRIP